VSSPDPFHSCHTSDHRVPAGVLSRESYGQATRFTGVIKVAMSRTAHRGHRTGALPWRLHQQGQVIGRGANLVYVIFDRGNQLIALRPHLLRVLDTPDGC
jgi:hypothetical protein